MSLSQETMSLSKKLKMISWPFLVLVTAVATVGFVSLYSAAAGSMDPWAGKQLIRFCFGMVGLVLVALVDIRFWFRVAYPFFVLVVLMLIFVDIRGHIGMGAQRWINIGILQLQPSEIMKIAIVLALARFFHGATRENVRNLFFLGVPAALIAVPVGLVVVQPDLGTAMTLVLASAAMFFMAGVRYRVFAVAAAGGLSLLPVVWHFLRDYQRQRVLIFLNPALDPLGAGYHITQSKIALGSGGITGKGFLHGTQSHLNFLPEKQTDFIFTLFAEEWGLIGGVVLMLLFAAIIAYGYVIAFQCRNQFGRLLAAGIVVNLSIYVFINIGMVMGLLPVVGVPLPMVSYGGTAMLSVLFGFGLLMSVHVHRDVNFTRRGLEMA